MKLRTAMAATVAICSLGVVSGLAGTAPASAAPPGGRVIALGVNNMLISFNGAAPSIFSQTSTITGVLLGESIVGIDVRQDTACSTASA